MVSALELHHSHRNHVEGRFGEYLRCNNVCPDL